MLRVGDTMPAVAVVDETGAAVETNDLLGKPLVVYFYPKADTPGCTSESVQFRDLYEQIRKAGADVVGVSRDAPAAQLKFKEKYELPFRLLADTESKVCDAFGVIVDKNMYGKKSRGVQRSTFLFDRSGKIVHVWPRVSVEGHAQDVVSRLP
jgi:peroxiredoxin Q/BCP